MFIFTILPTNSSTSNQKLGSKPCSKVTELSRFLMLKQIPRKRHLGLALNVYIHNTKQYFQTIRHQPTLTLGSKPWGKVTEQNRLPVLMSNLPTQF